MGSYSDNLKDLVGETDGLTPPPKLPDLVPPVGPPDEPSPETLGMTPQATLEETNISSSAMQLPEIANGTALPLVYGKARIGAQIGYPWTSIGTLNFPAFWCEGEVESITERTNGEVRDEESNYTREQYLGEPTQPLSPALSQPVDDEFNPGLDYTDTHDGVAYSVMFIGRDDDPRSVMAEIEGLKIYDPRDVTQTLGDASTYKYSANPALILADFHQRFRGDFEDISWTDVEVCADHCDENVGTTEAPVPRSEIGFVIKERKAWKQYFETLREYALCYTYYDANTLRMVPDKARATDATLTESDIIEDSLSIKQVDANQVPDMTIVQYTSTAGDEWTDATAESPAPTGGAKNPSVVNMNAWQSHQAAYRYAILRQNKHNMINLVGTFRTFDEGLSYHPGSVIELTHSRGLAQKKFTVLDVVAYDRARYEVSIMEYQPVWSDTLQDEAYYPDTNLPSPIDFPIVENLAGVEKLWADETGKYHTVFEVSFDGGDWPHTSGFRYSVTRVSDGLTLIEATIAYQGDVSHTFVTPPTTQDEQWAVKVWVQNKYNSIDPTQFATITLQGDGKSIPPNNIPAGTLKSTEFGQFVRLTWSPAADSDLSGYEVCRLNETDYDADVAAANDPFDNANTIQLISRIDAEVALLGAQPAGTFAYGVRPIDRAGNKALGRWTKQLVTAENAGAIGETELDVGVPSLTNMSIHEAFGIGNKAYSDYGDSWITRFGGVSGVTAAMVSVETVTLTFTANDGSKTATLSNSQDATQCAPMNCGWHLTDSGLSSVVAGGPGGNMFQINVWDDAGTPKVTASRISDTGTAPGVLVIPVVEFGSGVSVQKVTVSSPSDTSSSFDETITSVDQTKTFVLPYLRRKLASSGNNYDDLAVKVSFTSNTALNFSRHTTCNTGIEGYAYVIEDTDGSLFDVTQYDHTFSATSSAKTITSVTMSSTSVYITGTSTAAFAQPYHGAICGGLESATTIRFRSANASYSSNASAFVVEWLDGTTVQHDYKALSPQGSLATLTWTEAITSVDTSRSVVGFPYVGLPMTMHVPSGNNSWQYFPVHQSIKIDGDGLGLTATYRGHTNAQGFTIHIYAQTIEFEESSEASASGAWPVDQSEAWIHNQSSTAAQSVETEEWDTASDRTGAWLWNPADVTLYGGSSVTYTTELATATAYPTFTSHPSRTVSSDARYMKGKAALTPANADQGFSVLFPVDATYEGVVLEDQVDLTIINQVAGTAFSWTKDFSSTPRYWYVLKGTAAKIIALDSVDKDGGTAKAFDTSGNDASADIIIYAEGS